jgi:hypothetical protein
MAVETTPERSFSDLLRSSRAIEATAGCTIGASSVPRWLVVSMIRKVRTIDREGSARKVATRASVFSPSA